MSYFKDIVEAVTTIFEGLTITASHTLRRPITTQYPDKIPVPLQEMLPARYRGFLNVDMRICTGCTLCMQACPIQCIEIETIKQEGAPPKRLISKFNIDIGKCMFCGLCIDPCPTSAIHFTREFEHATKDLDDLVFRFVTGEPAAPYKRNAT